MRLFQTFALVCASLLSAVVVAQATTRHPTEVRAAYAAKKARNTTRAAFLFPSRRDLDFQPVLGVRTRLWVKECPHCGWIARDFSSPVPTRVRATFESEAYNDIADLVVPDNARIFLRVALLEDAAEQWGEAGLDYTAAAWCATPVKNAGPRQRRERKPEAESEMPDKGRSTGFNSLAGWLGGASHSAAKKRCSHHGSAAGGPTCAALFAPLPKNTLIRPASSCGGYISSASS